VVVVAAVVLVEERKAERKERRKVGRIHKEGRKKKGRASRH
jgi:hypothetical protein